MAGKYLIVGLGNPGRKYAKTRHNAGFHVVDALARRHNLPTWTEERKALTTDGRIQGKRVLLAKPQTYMNLSGEAVRALYDYYNIAIDQIIVVYDDLDLPLGTLRLRDKGGHGGQNGVRNIIQHLGTKKFSRVRFGIGRPPGRMKAKNYVLQPFHGDDAQLAQEVVETAANAIETWLQDGIQTAMSHYNGDVTETPPPSQEPDPKEQLAVAERAHELKSDDPRPLEKMAQLYQQLQRPDDAAQARVKLGELFQGRGNLKATIYQWQQAIKLQPDLTDIREELAHVYEEQQDPDRALRAWLDLATYHEKQNNLHGAMHAVLEALRVDPKNPEAQARETAYRKQLTM
jgi:PTH1 family peptidyl-tRNA hydrolase